MLEKEGTNGRLILNFRDISHKMKMLYEGKASQKRILIILNETGKITQKDLTERLRVQPASVSEILAKLELAGCITRTPNETDRRTTDVSLTEKGCGLARESERQREKRHEEMFACLGDEEKQQLLGLLEKINNDWRERFPKAEHRGHGGHNGHHRHGE